MASWCFSTGCASTGGGGKLELAVDPALRENIEWCDIWVTDADKKDLPRVLLIGDSITRGYFKNVESLLKGKAYCARLATSKCLCDPALAEEVDLMLEQYRFAVIHVNNGMHGWCYSDEQYGKAFGPFMDFLAGKSAGARLIWAQTTPVVVDGTTACERTQRVKVRNKIASAYAAEHHIPIDDLFGRVVDHPDYYTKDGVHFNQTGIDAQARQVADSIAKVLADRPADKAR